MIFYMLVWLLVCLLIFVIGYAFDNHDVMGLAIVGGMLLCTVEG